MKNRKLLGFLVIAALGITACGKNEETESTVQDTLVIESTTEEESDDTEEFSVEDTEIEDNTEEKEITPDDVSDVEIPEPKIEIAGTDYNWGAIDGYYDYINGVFPYVRYKEEYTTIDKELEDMSASEIITQTFAISNNRLIDLGGSVTIMENDEQTYYSELGPNGVAKSSDGDPEFESYIDYINGMYYEVNSGITTYDNSNTPLYIRDDFTPLGLLNPMTVQALSTRDFEVKYITPNGGAIEVEISKDGTGMTIVIDPNTREILVLKTDNMDILFDYGAMAIDITGIEAVASPMYTNEELNYIPQY